MSGSGIPGVCESCGAPTTHKRWKKCQKYECRYGSLRERFFKYLSITTSCWLWAGAVNKAGYGIIAYKRNCYLAHRVSFEMFVGPIPQGLQLDHLCRVHNCVNPDHLDIVTKAENQRRGVAAKTHCVHGHLYDAKNTYRKPHAPTVRRCRTCEGRPIPCAD